MTPEEQRMEHLAERLRAVEMVGPSPGAKIRGWNLVMVAVDQSATSRAGRRPVALLLIAGFVAAILLVAGAIAASADSLPDSPLYPVKGAVETARGAFLFSPSDRLTYQLDLAQTRLAEAEAMVARHRIDLAGPALEAMGDRLSNAAELVKSEKPREPAIATDLQSRLRQAVAAGDRQLASLQGQVTNPAVVSAIARARQRAAAALQLADQPSPAATGSPATLSPAATASATGSSAGSPAPRSTASP